VFEFNFAFLGDFDPVIVVDVFSTFPASYNNSLSDEG